MADSTAEEPWDGGWAANAAAKRRDWASMSPVQLLEWLDEALDFACAAGALDADRVRRPLIWAAATVTYRTRPLGAHGSTPSDVRRSRSAGSSTRAPLPVTSTLQPPCQSPSTSSTSNTTSTPSAGRSSSDSSAVRNTIVRPSIA